MKRLRSRVSVAASVLGLGAPGLLFASCAGPSEEPAAKTIGGDASEASPPAGDAGLTDGASAPPACERGTWCPASTPLAPNKTLTAIWGSSKDDVWVVGSAGTILHWDGATWIDASFATLATLYSIWGSGPRDIWITSSATLVLHGTGFEDGVARWELGPSIPFEPRPGGIPAGIWGKITTAVWGTSANDVWIAGEAVVNPPPGEGVTWMENVWHNVVVEGQPAWAGTPPGRCVGRHGFACPDIRALWGTGPEDLWAVAPRSAEGPGRIFHRTSAPSEDGGSDGWTELESQTTSSLYAVWGSSANDVWTVGDRGTIRHWSKGAALEMVASPTLVTLRSVWGSGPNDVWAVGDDSVILHYDGQAWTPSRVTPPADRARRPALYGVWGSGRGDVWAVGEGIVFELAGSRSADDGSAP